MLTNHVIMPYDIYVPKTLIVKKVFKRRTAKNGGTEYLVQLKYFDDSTWEPTQNAIASFEEELRIKVKSLKFSSEDSRPELISQKVIQSQTLTFRWLVQIFKTELGLYRYRYFAKEKGGKKIKLSIRLDPKKRHEEKETRIARTKNIFFWFLGVLENNGL